MSRQGTAPEIVITGVWPATVVAVNVPVAEVSRAPAAR